MKKQIPVVCSILCILLIALPALAASPDESLRKSFPNLRVDSIRPSGVEGLYEVVSGTRVLYYAPGPEYLLYGPMVTREGRNLTDERSLEILGKGLKEIPLEKAIRVGSGPVQIIEIMDPDCPYCRRASDYLSKRSDVTRYIFLFPLSIHPNAEAKIRQILCAEDRGKAYEEAMAGRLDDMKFTACKSDPAEDLARTHREICNRIGVTGTPLFLIEGQVIFGADIPRMEGLLNRKK